MLRLNPGWDAMKRVMIQTATFMILLITTVSIATPTHWRFILPGLQYAQLSRYSGFHQGYIHAFRVDLRYYQLELAIANDHHNTIATVAELTQLNKGLLGINGGFFSQELHPLGLRIGDYRLRNAFKPIAWWGVFYIKDNKPHIVNPSHYHYDTKMQFAVQGGPRLIVDGTVVAKLKAGADRRSALGITRGNEVILAVTDNLNLTTTQLAQIMAKPQKDNGLDCVNAINIDGGSSTQLYAHINHFFLQVPGYGAVTDAILVLPRESNAFPGPRNMLLH